MPYLSFLNMNRLTIYSIGIRFQRWVTAKKIPPFPGGPISKTVNIILSAVEVAEEFLHSAFSQPAEEGCRREASPTELPCSLHMCNRFLLQRYSALSSPSC